MKTENVAESHQTDIPYTFPAGHETTQHKTIQDSRCLYKAVRFHMNFITFSYGGLTGTKLP